VIQRQLTVRGVRFTYEELTIPFVQPQKPRKYKPDFVLLSNGIIVESKGRLVTADRQKHILIQSQFPALDIRFVFSRSSTRISKQSRTTYAQWASDHDFKYADKLIPEAWISEPPNVASLRAIAALQGRPYGA
jgi:Autographiviridae endonuclease I